MSKVRSIIQYTCVFSLGALLSYVLIGSMRSQPPASPEATATFGALLRASDLPIPEQALSCEVAGPTKDANGKHAYPDTKVRDYIAAYLVWSRSRTRHSSTSLACEGANVKQCTWVFGEAKSEEGWGSFLRFEYDQRSNSVVPSSLSCIDVP
jgi:hypothetical protein